MGEFPRITVIMGIYNCADTLVEALKSLEAQTYQRFKVILCDDGSRDNTLEVAKKWAETHLNYIVIRNEHNMGLNATLNHCLEYVDTEFVARMDGDDEIGVHASVDFCQVVFCNQLESKVDGSVGQYDEEGCPEQLRPL